jgi:hypothetical protein
MNDAHAAHQPAFHDDLEAALADALRRLAEAVTNRRSAFHTPTLGTVGRGDARPRLRTVVLRGFDSAAPSLRFHTDRRSEKFEELRSDPQVGMHFYDAAAKLQLRFDGWARLHTEDAVADAAWAASRVASRQCYGIEPGPGQAIRSGGDYTMPAINDEAVAVGRKHFCAVTVAVANLEWLHLAASGHRRASFDWTIDGWSKRWLAP